MSKRTPKPPPTEVEILKAIRRIEREVIAVWSIPIARKRACGYPNSPLNRAVSERIEFQIILCAYAEKTGHKNQYIFRAKLLEMQNAA